MVKKKEKVRLPANNPGIQAGAGSFSLCHEEKKKNNKEVSHEGHEEHEGEKKITNNKSQITKEIGIRQKAIGISETAPSGQVKEFCHEEHEETQRKKKIDRFTGSGLIHQTQQVNRLRKGLILRAPSCSSWLKKQITNTSDAPSGQRIKI